MGQRSPTELAAIDLLIDQVNQLTRTIEVITGQRSPTKLRQETNALISRAGLNQVEAQIKQLSDTLEGMASDSP